jgi:SAM-dependent methyltransferase
MSQAFQADRASATQRPANFDFLARPYRWMELFTFGPYLARCRTAFLPDGASCRRALILGDGDGRFTAQLLRINPEIEIDAVDASPKMLEALARRVGPDRARVRTFCADVHDFQPPNPPYDLVVTHFFLDCLRTEEVGFLAATLRSAVAENALWIVSDFSVPPGWFGRLVAGPLVWFLYRAFGVLTGLSVRILPDHESALGQAEFTLKRRIPLLHRLLISELWTTRAGAGPAS